MPPGSILVLTGHDIENLAPMPMFQGVPNMKVPKGPFSRRIGLHWVGHPVVAIVAESRQTAEDAFELVDVEYEPMPGVSNAEEAMAEGAPLVHEKLGTNVSFEIVRQGRRSRRRLRVRRTRLPRFGFGYLASSTQHSRSEAHLRTSIRSSTSWSSGCRRRHRGVPGSTSPTSWECWIPGAGHRPGRRRWFWIEGSDVPRGPARRRGGTSPPSARPLAGRSDRRHSVDTPGARHVLRLRSRGRRERDRHRDSGDTDLELRRLSDLARPDADDDDGDGRVQHQEHPPRGLRGADEHDHDRSLPRCRTTGWGAVHRAGDGRGRRGDGARSDRAATPELHWPGADAVQDRDRCNVRLGRLRRDNGQSARAGRLRRAAAAPGRCP